MREPKLMLDPSMVQRAEDAYAANGDMEEAIRAAFHDVPLSNFAIGTLLEPFDLVVCMVAGGGVGVYARIPGDLDGFDALSHSARLTYGRTSQLRGLAISGIEWPRDGGDRG